MLGFILSILTAFSMAFKDVYSKKSLKKVDPYTAAWALRFFSFLFLLPLLFFTGMPKIEQDFLFALPIVVSLNLITTVLYMKALKESDISLTIPLISLTPLFMLVTSPLILYEYASFYGVLGVIFIVLGAYSLNIRKMDQGTLAPFKALLTEKGPRLMLAVAFIWSITGNYDKIGVLNSSPIFWAIAVNLLIAVFLLPFLIKKSKFKEISPNLRTLLPIGFFLALMSVFQMTAISLTLVSYVIAIKRTGALISVFFGYLFFKEKNIRERAIGALLMVIGVILIGIS